MECTMLSMPFILNTMNADLRMGIGRDHKEGSPQGQENLCKLSSQPLNCLRCREAQSGKLFIGQDKTQLNGAAFGKKD